MANNHIRSCRKFLNEFNEYLSLLNIKYSDFSHNKIIGLFTLKLFTILKPNLLYKRDRKITKAYCERRVKSVTIW